MLQVHIRAAQWISTRGLLDESERADGALDGCAQPLIAQSKIGAPRRFVKAAFRESHRQPSLARDYTPRIVVSVSSATLVPSRGTIQRYTIPSTESGKDNQVTWYNVLKAPS